ncbi:MAG: hypothetical protein M3O34_09735 [Chloroflexota bacterium]|nr:hypothetical protein [Chloroflexota bacterium]
MHEVILRLSKETAQELRDLIYMHGEHIAAGAPINDMGWESNERLARVLRSIEAQLGRTAMYGAPAPPSDAVL